MYDKIKMYDKTEMYVQCMTKMMQKCMTLYDKIKMYDKNCSKTAKNGYFWAKFSEPRNIYFYIAMRVNYLIV